ncbi:MAG: alanine racemase [Gemmatimonadaceae bacterium]
MPALSRAWVEVDLAALCRNAAAAASSAGAPLLPMVKADAYGLGAVPVARALESIEPWGFGVATIDEGVELREGGISRPVVVFTPLLVHELEAAAAASLTPALGSSESILQWRMYGLPYHLSVDTGMSRAGVPWREVAQLKDALEANPPSGAFTHFHSAQLDDSSMAAQISRFNEALTSLSSRPLLVHAEGSAAIVRHRGVSWDLARPGIFLYGVATVSGASVEPEPVVHLRGMVVDIRTIEPGDTVSYDATFTATSRTRIATVGIGYADGYPRSLSNTGEALVGGGRVSIAGRVTMDMVMLDVTGVDCDLGDVVTLIGRSPDGGGILTVAAVAEKASMSPYELLTGLKSRTGRTYLDA